MEKYRSMDARVASTSAVSVFMSHVYQWMTAGLLCTAFAAFLAIQYAQTSALFASIVPTIILGIAVVALPLVLSFRIAKLSAGAATGIFLGYSALMGVFLAPALIVYTGASVSKAFVCTAGMFAAMSAYGTVTKRDLTGFGNFLFMGLIGLLIAMLVNLFLQSSAMDFVISAIGVLVFTGLTAYDTQKLREFGQNAPVDDALAMRRGAILGALTLYLDIINLFLMLIRLFDDRS